MHLNINNNSKILYDIIEKENPEIIFEEIDISRTEDEYYKNGPYRYQNFSSVETIAIMNYLENHHIKHIPVDTYEVTSIPNDIYSKISNNSIEYSNLVKMNHILSSQYGFPYINSNECSDILEKINEMEENIVKNINDNILTNSYNSWKLIADNRDNEMLKNIYNYSKNHSYNKAIFIVGADHKKSIIDKIKECDINETIKLNWKTWRIA